MIPLKTAPVAVSASAQTLQPITKVLVNRQTITDLTDRGNSDPSIISINSPGEVINAFPLPSKVTVTVENTNALDTDPLEVNIFNNSYLEEAPAGVNITYSDGFRGHLLEKMFSAAQNGQGVLFYGFNVTGYDADSIKSDVVVNDTNLTQVVYKGVAKTAIPFEINLSGSERNTQFKDGLLTVKIAQIVNVMTQVRLNLAAKCKVQFVFFTNPLKD